MVRPRMKPLGRGAAHVDQQGAGAWGNFAGLTAALSLKHELQDGVDVTVLSKSDQFQFNPSFIWIPSGRRMAQEYEADADHWNERERAER
jgi:NADH dehydrogenase FAD-containing subunit